AYPSSATFRASSSGRTSLPDNAGSGHSTEVLAILIDPEQPWTVYEGTRDGGLLKSTDGGATWHPWNNTFADSASVSDLAFAPAGGTAFAVVTRPGDAAPILMRSTDGGTSWSPVASNVQRVAIASSNPSVVFATGAA